MKLAGVLSGLRHRFPLRGKNALVTGGSRGLGLEIARVLVERGANVAILARSSEDIERALVDLSEHRTSATALILGETCDLCDSAAIDAAFASLHERLGPIDVLVNNAGTIQVGPLDSVTGEDFESAMRLHCYAPLRTMLAVREGMKARGGGRIANIASIGGVVSVPHLLPYSTSKFALMGLSQGMRAELSRDGILVSTIAPGLMRTGSPRNATFKGEHRKEYAWFTLSDSLPPLSLSSRRAARRIVRAIERGEPHVVLGLPAKLAMLASGFAPGLVNRAMTLANSLLPKGTAQRAHHGFDSESKLAPSILTVLTERAASLNNQR
ncbi:MAG TPA: SDR family oxidoreductase [Polyangiales bacterium]|nr:SDR family oxidoreductase [Polyangiales bacterium]